MTKKEYKDLLVSIRNIYPNFKGNDELLNYDFDEVKANFLKLKSNEEPTFEEITKGLKTISTEKPVIMQCEYCKEKELVTDTREWLEKHRICQKIDFIDRESKRIKGVGVNKLKYYQMSSYELEKCYREIMNNWIKTHKNVQPFQKI